MICITKSTNIPKISDKDLDRKPEVVNGDFPFQNKSIKMKMILRLKL